MAITVTGAINPVVVTGTTAESAAIISDRVHVKGFYWYNPTTAGDLLTLKDEFGTTILPLRCEADGQSQFFSLDCWFHGILTDDMDSGTLYIYIV